MRRDGHKLRQWSERHQTLQEKEKRQSGWTHFLLRVIPENSSILCLEACGLRIRGDGHGQDGRVGGTEISQVTRQSPQTHLSRYHASLPRSLRTTPALFPAYIYIYKTNFSPATRIKTLPSHTYKDPRLGRVLMQRNDELGDHSSGSREWHCRHEEARRNREL